MPLTHTQTCGTAAYLDASVRDAGLAAVRKGLGGGNYSTPSWAMAEHLSESFASLIAALEGQGQVLRVARIGRCPATSTLPQS